PRAGSLTHRVGGTGAQLIAVLSTHLVGGGRQVLGALDDPVDEGMELAQAIVQMSALQVETIELGLMDVEIAAQDVHVAGSRAANELAHGAHPGDREPEVDAGIARAHIRDAVLESALARIVGIDLEVPFGLALEGS